MVKLVCPDCWSTNVTSGRGGRLHKCNSCHLAFETWDEDELIEEGLMLDEFPSWDDLDNERKDDWLNRVEASLDLRDLWINADDRQAGVLRELIDRIGRERFAEQFGG